MQTPQVYTESNTLVLEIGDETIEAVQLKTVTLFPNGTKKIHVSIAVEEMPGSGLIAMLGKPLLRVNGTKVIHPQAKQTTVVDEDEPKFSNMKYSPDQQDPTYGAQSISEPVPPPDASPPPLPRYDWYWRDDEVLFLRRGVKYPTNGDPPFYVRYDQPDNYYNYWPNDLWAPWYFMVTKIYVHITKTAIENFIDGIEDLCEFFSRNLGLAGAALALGGGIVTFIGAIATAAGISLSWVPPVGLGILAVGVLTAILATNIESEGYEHVEWAQETVMTDRGDGFCFFDIGEGSNLFWMRPAIGFRWPPNNGPKTIIYHTGERNYFIAWGKDLQEETWTHYSTEWCYHLFSWRATPLPSLAERWHGGWIVRP